MSHAPNRVFDTAVGEIIDRLDALDALKAPSKDEIAVLLEAIWDATAGDVAAFDAAIAELGRRLRLAAIWDALPELLRMEDRHVAERFRILAGTTPEEVRQTPAIRMDDVARKRAARLLAAGG